MNKINIESKEFVFFSLLVLALIFLVGFSSLIPQFTGIEIVEGCPDFSPFADRCQQICEYYYPDGAWMLDYCCGNNQDEYYFDGECCDVPNCVVDYDISQSSCENGGFVWITDPDGNYCCGDDDYHCTLLIGDDTYCAEPYNLFKIIDYSSLHLLDEDTRLCTEDGTGFCNYAVQIGRDYDTWCCAGEVVYPDNDQQDYQGWTETPLTEDQYGCDDDYDNDCDGLTDLEDPDCIPADFYTLITDTNNHRVIEVNSAGDIIWSYSTGLNTPYDADRLSNGNTLISDTLNHRVIEVTPLGDMVWSKTGNEPAWDADRLDSGITLISGLIDTLYVYEIASDGTVVWSYGTSNILTYDSDRLSNGNTLMTSASGAGEIVEIDSASQIVWGIEYQENIVDRPASVERLDNGNTLIADSDNNRVIEIDNSKQIVWSKTDLYAPRDAHRLDNGNTLIADTNNHRVIEINSAGDIIWSYSTGLLRPSNVERIPA